MMLITLDLVCSIVLVGLFYRWVVTHHLLVKPRVFHVANVIFLMGMLPWFDSLARYSIWLHSSQSVMVHHLAPILWVMALKHPLGKAQADNKPSVLITLLLSLFALLTWVWMLPSLHSVLMQSAGIYTLMKWLMALSGLALCLTMLTHSTHSQYWRWLNSMTVTLPLVVLGGVMFVIPDIYSNAHNSLHQHHQMMANLPVWLQLDAYNDQLLGGVIFLFAAYVYWLKDNLSDRLSSHAWRVSE
jgi:hypothetical protein